MADKAGKSMVEALGLQMAYVDRGGGGHTFVLLHGNPTSSYLWREVIPPLLPQGRCVAPDLLGMGDSAPLPDPGPGSYTFADHRRHLDAFLDAIDLPEQIVLVVHDWGSSLGFDWARRNPDRVSGIAYMEAIVAPMGWDDWPEGARRPFRMMRSEAGEEAVLQQNFFVERILPSSIIRELSDEEMAEYRRPFTEPGEGRRPTLSWPRQMPLAGEPAEVVSLVTEYAEWLAGSPVPKLFVNAEPGMILTGPQREACRKWPNQTEVTVAGLHFVQEDSGTEIGEAIAAWSQQL